MALTQRLIGSRILRELHTLGYRGGSTALYDSLRTLRVATPDPRVTERYETPPLPAGCRRVWLLASHQGLPSGTAASRAHYAKYLAVRRGLTRAYGGAGTTRFGYASVIWVQLFSR